MTMIRVVLVAAVLAVVPTVAWAQTTTTTASTTTSTSTSTSTTVAPTTTTTTAEVTRIEDLVCSEPVNSVATCVDPQGRIVRRIDDVAQTTTTTVRPAQPAQPSGGVPLALTG